MLVHVYSGLMSRCGVLAQAFRLMSQNNDRDLTVIWPLEKDCRIHYDEVFSSESLSGINVRVIEYDQFKARDIKKLFPDVASIIDEFKKRSNYRSFRSKYDKEMIGKRFFDYAPPREIGWIGEPYTRFVHSRWDEVRQYIKENGTGDLAVHAFSNIIYGDEAEDIDLKCIVFDDALVSRAGNIVNDPKTIGLHVRRTDHIAAIENSTTDKFFNTVEKEISSDDSVRFFLATDSPEEEQHFIEKFGDRIIVQNDKSWGRNDTASVQSGVVDMLCLSGCGKIYGSHGSVFSYFASRYGDKPLETV